jgi:hypothetical protein
MVGCERDTAIHVGLEQVDRWMNIAKKVDAHRRNLLEYDF